MAEVRKLTVPSDLRLKAVNYRVGVDVVLSPEMLAQLDKVVAKSKQMFLFEVAALLEAMNDGVAEAQNDTSNRAAFLEDAAEASFKVKGLGSMFDFPLLTSIAKSLLHYVEGIASPDDRQVALIGLHISAMHVVLRRHMTGTGGETEKAVLDAFKEATDRIR